MTRKGCCDEFVQARQIGTDNEMYGRLIRREADGNYSIGCDLPSMSYCPWCGEYIVHWSSEPGVRQTIQEALEWAKSKEQKKTET